MEELRFQTAELFDFPAIGEVPVFLIADDRVADGSEGDAELMGAARKEMELQQGIVPITLHGTVFGDRRFAAVFDRANADAPGKGILFE